MYFFCNVNNVYLNISIDSSKNPKTFCCFDRLKTVTREEIQILTSKNSLFSIVFTVVDCAIVNEMKQRKTATIARFIVFR